MESEKEAGNSTKKPLSEELNDPEGEGGCDGLVLEEKVGLGLAESLGLRLGLGDGLPLALGLGDGAGADT